MELLEGTSGLVIYLGLKLGGYLCWGYAGVRWLGRGSRRPVALAVELGVARLVLGWATGIVVAPAVIVAVRLDQVPLFYFTGFPLVRWFEWAVIQQLIPGAGGGAAAFVTGGSAAGRIWRAIGVVVSYLADAPFLLAGGFPHGRIFC